MKLLVTSKNSAVEKNKVFKSVWTLKKSGLCNVCIWWWHKAKILIPSNWIFVIDAKVDKNDNNDVANLQRLSDIVGDKYVINSVLFFSCMFSDESNIFWCANKQYS